MTIKKIFFFSKNNHVKKQQFKKKILIINFLSMQVMSEKQRTASNS